MLGDGPRTELRLHIAARCRAGGSRVRACGGVVDIGPDHGLRDPVAGREREQVGVFQLQIRQPMPVMLAVEPVRSLRPLRESAIIVEPGRLAARLHPGVDILFGPVLELQGERDALCAGRHHVLPFLPRFSARRREGSHRACRRPWC